MLFSSTVFLLFFLPILLCIYFAIPKRFIPARNAVLLVFSLIFYGWGGMRYLALLLVSVSINYGAGILLGMAKSQKQRNWVMLLAAAANLGLLAVYKYAGFAVSCLNLLGFSLQVPQIVLPIGISFFTFQGLSYVIDVYRRDTQVQRNPLNVALYVALFPQLVAGPIVRYTTIEQALSARSHGLEDFTRGVIRFLLGFGKKMILANTMGLVADEIFSMAQSDLTTPLAWIGAISYALQIYFDFSAYSDMAIGLGWIFGFHFLENFNYPYIAASVTEFWRRWHISLSSWFRDYVYIPLGGNRCSLGRQILNLMAVWSLTGLWHGANWTFIAWGVYFGVLLILEKYVLHEALARLPGILRHGYTLLAVLISWVLFRSDTLGQAIAYIGILFGYGSAEAGMDPAYYLIQYAPEYLLALVGVFPLKNAAQAFCQRHRAHLSVRFCEAVIPSLTALIAFFWGYMRLVTGSFNPFIYFQF